MWANERKFLVIQSIGSTATAIAVIITLWDIRKRQEQEHVRFLFESEPFVTIEPVDMKTLGEEDIRKVKYSEIINGVTGETYGEDISHPFSTILSVKNDGKGLASDVVIYMSQDLRFLTNQTITDGPMEISPNSEKQITKLHFYQKQDLSLIDWQQDFYVKVVYSSLYLNNKYEGVFKYDVKRIIVQEGEQKVDQYGIPSFQTKAYVRSVCRNIIPVYGRKLVTGNRKS